MVDPITRLVQVLFRLFREMIAGTEELYRFAMAPQLSPDCTVYSIGGSSVGVGVSVGTRVSVGVVVRVGVSVAVGTAVGSWILLVAFRVKYKTAAPITKKTARMAIATGKLSVTSGIRDPWIAFSDFAFFLGGALNSLPHTTQRVAFSAMRVPQVGQSLEVVVSGLIVRGLYHEANV
jgi:hypothetical protein